MAIVYQTSEDADGKKVILTDDKGLPIVMDDEKEDVTPFGIDAIHLLSKVPALQTEAKGHRLKAEEANKKLETFAGIDPAKATEALKLAANLSAGDLTKKEEVERIKQETEDAWKGKIEALALSHQEELKAKDDALADMDDDLRGSLLTTNFAKSPHFTGKEPNTKLTPDIAEAYFGKSFKIEKDEQTGKRTAVGYIGENVIYSKSKPGTIAQFDEAMDLIIAAYPMKEAILFKSQGSGAPGSGGGGHRRGQTIASGDAQAFGNNLEEIAKGKIKVV